MQHARLDALKRDLRFNHWEQVYNWTGIDNERTIEVISSRHNCTPKQVKDTMKAIERQYPKPNRSSAEKIAQSMPNGGTCKYCGETIVWIHNLPCNPPVFKGVTAEGTILSVRELHTETCKKDLTN